MIRRILGGDGGTSASIGVHHGERLIHYRQRAGNQIDRVLNAYATEHGIPVFVSVPHERLSAPSYEPGQLHVRFYSAPGREGEPKPHQKYPSSLNRILGFDICDRNQRFALTPEYEGIVLTDGDIPYAEIVGSTLYVLFDLPHSECSCSAVSRIMEKILEEAHPHLGMISAEISFDPAENRAVFAERIVESSASRQECLDRDMQRLDGAVQDRMKDLAKAVRERRDTALRQQILSGSDLSSLEEMFDSITALPDVDRATVTGGMLRVFTTPVIIQHNGRNRDIGEFEMQISFQPGVMIRLQNKTRRVGNCDHPHIANGNPCWGNIGAMVSQLHGEGRMLDLVQLLILFLKSYHEDGVPHLRIDKWPRA